MKIDIDIWDDVELDAFGDFLKTIAAYRRINANDKMVGLAPPAERVAELKTEIAAHLKEDEPEPVATPAPAEKKTRSRKAKDAPAVSVSSADAADALVEAKADEEIEGGAETPAISTGEERIGPEDDAATIAQDEADEKAESDAARDPEKPLTLDDVRVAMGAYATAYGMDAALADGPAIYNKALGPVPDGTKNAKGEIVKEWCLTATPLDQESLAKTVQYWQAALTENPFKHAKAAA